MQPYPYPPVEVKVWGDIACFTRPDAKVERVTYDVMTPSAARGVLESIFWKREMQWRVREILVLHPVRHISLVRNEVKSRVSATSAQIWSKRGGGYYADEDHTPRHTVALRDVAYIIRADALVVPGVAADPAKYRHQFRERVKKGQCYRTPFLGCREFAASFEPPNGKEQVQDVNTELEWMLFDLAYQGKYAGWATPHFFETKVVHGVLTVPDHHYDELSRLSDEERGKHAVTSAR